MYPTRSVNLLKFLQIYTSNSTSIISKFFSFSWRFICILSQISLITVSFLDIFMRNEVTIIDVAMNVLNAGLCFATIFRLYHFYVHDEDVKEIIRNIDENFRKKSSTDLDEITMTPYEVFARKITKIWSSTLIGIGAFVTITCVILLPIVGKTIPFPGWYPYDWKKPVYYELTLFTQGLTEIISVSTHASSDIFYIVCLFLISGQFDLLSHEIKNLIYTSLLNYGIPKNEVLEFSRTFNNDFYSLHLNENDGYHRIIGVIRCKRFQEILRGNIVGFIIRHQRILGFFKKFHRFASTFIMGALGFVLFYLIFICFTLVNSNEMSMVFAMAQYFIAAFNSVFLYTYFAQVLINKSEHLVEAFYEFPWYLGHNRETAPLFKFLQRNIMRPFNVKAGPFFCVNIGTFLMITKSAFSYLTVLTSVTGN